MTAQEAVGVDAVDMDVAVPLRAEEAPIRNGAGKEEERRGERRDPRGQPRAGVDGYGGGGGGGAAGGCGLVGGGSAAGGW
jgi:hypothetical protein